MRNHTEHNLIRELSRKATALKPKPEPIVAAPVNLGEKPPRQLFLSWPARTAILKLFGEMLLHPDGRMTLQLADESDPRIRSIHFLQRWRIAWVRITGLEVEFRFQPAVVREIAECEPRELEGLIEAQRQRREFLTRRKPCQRNTSTTEQR